MFLLLSFCLTSTGFVIRERDPYTIKGQYVQELIDLDDEELSALPFVEAAALFEKAFGVDARSFTEEEIRLGLEGLAFGLRVQELHDSIKSTADSTTGKTIYTGSIGVAWVRDTKKSPLTLGEILSGVYTLEVDWLTYQQATIILAASASYDFFSELRDGIITGVGSAVLTEIICAALGLSYLPATITSFAVGLVVGLGWNYLRKIDRARMYDCYTTMNNTYMMKVQFMWASHKVNKIYTRVYRTVNIHNPFPGTYGYWYKDNFGYLYSY